MQGVTTKTNRLGVDCLRPLRDSVGYVVKERVVRYLAGIGVGVQFGVHSSNVKNLARGVVERVFYVVRDGGLARPPQPIPGVFKRLMPTRAKLLRVLRRTPVVERDDYPLLYSGRKQNRYALAAESLRLRAVELRDSFVNTFVKAEKVNLSKKGDPAPRVIQPRSPRYNLEVGRYLKLFEVEMCQGFRRAFGYKVVLKGLNADDVALQLRANWDSFVDPVGFGLDASRFDQHVSQDALKFEHSVYNQVFGSPELARLLRMQLCNTGFARAVDGGFSYKVDGCRMSGDINTGMGNCLIMSCIVLQFISMVGARARLANNGDDCVVICEKADLHLFDNIDRWFLDFGFTLTREPTQSVFERLEFCQFQPVLLSTGWRMVRNPRVAMSKDATSLLPWSTPDEVAAWMGAIGTCGLSLTRGVPVWEAWYRRLVSMGVEVASATERVVDSGLGYASRGVLAAEVDDAARYSFYLAFGILPDMQVALEEEYRKPLVITGPVAMTFPEVQTLDNHENPISQHNRG
jgi:hypothetical protein